MLLMEGRKTGIFRQKNELATVYIKLDKKNINDIRTKLKQHDFTRLKGLPLCL